MGILPRPQEAPAPRLASAQSIAYLFAGILVVMVLGQLFTLDGFIDLVFAMQLNVGWQGSALLAPLIITLEVFALPFLLRMTISPAFRWFSMICGWLVSVVWFYISFSLAYAGTTVSTVGFLGSFGDLMPGWWAVSISLLLGLMAMWTSVGLWPGVSRAPRAE